MAVSEEYAQALRDIESLKSELKQAREELRLNEGMLELQTERADNNELAWQKSKATLETVRGLPRYLWCDIKEAELIDPDNQYVRADELEKELKGTRQ